MPIKSEKVNDPRRAGREDGKGDSLPWRERIHAWQSGSPTTIAPGKRENDVGGTAIKERGRLEPSERKSAKREKQGLFMSLKDDEENNSE